MFEKRLLNPDEVWDYFHDNSEEFVDYDELIAYNEAFGVEVYLGSYKGYVLISVMVDSVLDYERVATTQKDCEDTVSKVYNEYLVDSLIFDDADGIAEADKDDDIVVDDNTIIDDNEDELDSAVIDFLITSLKMSYVEVMRIPKKVRDDLKDHFLEYMYRMHGIEAYRPMIIEYDNDDEEFTTNPYKNLAFDSGYLVYPTIPPVFDISKLKDN